MPSSLTVAQVAEGDNCTPALRVQPYRSTAAARAEASVGRLYRRRGRSGGSNLERDSGGGRVPLAEGAKPKAAPAASARPARATVRAQRRGGGAAGATGTFGRSGTGALGRSAASTRSRGLGRSRGSGSSPRACSASSGSTSASSGLIGPSAATSPWCAASNSTLSTSYGPPPPWRQSYRLSGGRSEIPCSLQGIRHHRATPRKDSAARCCKNAHQRPEPEASWRMWGRVRGQSDLSLALHTGALRHRIARPETEGT